MKLYHSPGACSLAPHIVLREAALTFEPVRVDLKTHTLADGSDYRAIHGRGCVPLLELDDGQRIGEVPAILQYLADRAPAAGLAPAAGTLDRTRLQEWLGFVNSELHPDFGLLFDRHLPAETRAAVTTRLRARLDWAQQRLQGRAHVLGERFSVADAYLFVILGWTRLVGLDVRDWPALAAHTQRVAARPAVRAAMVAEGLVAGEGAAA